MHESNHILWIPAEDFSSFLAGIAIASGVISCIGYALTSIVLRIVFRWFYDFVNRGSGVRKSKITFCPDCGISGGVHEDCPKCGRGLDQSRYSGL